MEENYQLSFDFMTNFEDTGKLIGKVGIFKTKKCTKCNKEFEATLEFFNKQVTTKDKLKYICKVCDAENTRKSTLNRKLEGIFCINCNELKLENSIFCIKHYMYSCINSQIRMGRFKHINTSKQKHELIKDLINKLILQDYKCAITGEKLELGSNTSLDHIINISEGGNCHIENLQWVTKEANARKPRKYKND